MTDRIDAWIENNLWVVPAVLAAAVAIVFGPTLGFGFVYDDRWFIVENAALTGFSPAWFRVVGVFLHALNGLFVWSLLKRAAPASAALLAALLFLVHPAQVESVVWISQRSVAMCAFGALAAMMCWEKAEEHPRWSALALVFYAFSLLSKETAIGLPLYLALRLETRQDARVRWLPAFAAVMGGYLILRGHVLGHWGQQVALPTTFGESLADGARGFAHYARIAALPFGLNASYQWPSSAPLRAPDFWAGVFILAALVAGIFLLWNARRRIALGFVVIVLFWAPHSGALPLVTFAADRFLYLPMVGVAFVFCSALIEKPRLQPVALALLLVLGALSVRRAADWKSDLTLERLAARHGRNDKMPDRL